MTTLAANNIARIASLSALCASPAIIIFLSSNFVNIGNLAFNMIFSRWMGPELFGDLSVVLTIKLALLGVFGALSFAVSHKIAALDTQDEGKTEQALARINRFCFVGQWLGLPLFAAAIYAGSIDTRLDLASPYLLYILLGSLPFCAPLNILRGVALGRMNSAKIVYSANIEMAVRFGLGVTAWQCGLGIEGVVAAIGLSIIAGWAVLRDLLPTPALTFRQAKPVALSLGVATLPFALMQIAQVMALDGDIFLATRFLSNLETGFVAALSLFQRIQFFACFALAGVLLPSVVISVRNGRAYRQHIFMITGLLAAVSVTVLSLSLYVPEQLLTLLVGAEYIAASAHLIWVAGASVVFTTNYLIATFLMAQGCSNGVRTLVIGSLLQIACMTFVLSAPAGDLSAMLTTKLTCQLGILATLLAQLWTSTAKLHFRKVSS